MKSNTTKEAEKALKAASPSYLQTAPRAEDFLSTSVTVLNLGCYGRTFGGMAKGYCYRMAGKSSAGKSMLARAILAEACRNKFFNNYELIYDDVEHGSLMDTEKFFGKKLMHRLSAPARTKKNTPIYSKYISDFFSRLQKRLDAGKPFIWIEDSLDALSPDAAGPWKQTKMSDNKAKAYSQELRKMMDGIYHTKSILLLICQARANMNALSLFDPQDITAGGRALEHYPSLEIWLKKARTLRSPYRGLKMPIGSVIKAHIAKNRISGQNREVYFRFYPDSGIDDTGSCVDYLVHVKHWRSPKSKEEEEVITLAEEKVPKAVIAPEFDFEGPVETLIREIEAKNLERELQILTGKVWKEVAEACSVHRKKRYE